MAPHNLDEIDYKILNLLRVDARRSNIELARQTGRSEGAIRRRIRFLTQNGYLSIVAFADPVKLGYNVHTITGLKVAMGKANEIVQKLATMNEVTYVTILTGRFDIMFHAWFKDLDGLKEFLNTSLPAAEGIIYSETFTVLEISKRTYGYMGELIPKPRPKRARSVRAKRASE